MLVHFNKHVNFALYCPTRTPFSYRSRQCYWAGIVGTLLILGASCNKTSIPEPNKNTTDLGATSTNNAQASPTVAPPEQTIPTECVIDNDKQHTINIVLHDPVDLTGSEEIARGLPSFPAALEARIQRLSDALTHFMFLLPCEEQKNNQATLRLEMDQDYASWQIDHPLVLPTGSGASFAAMVPRVNAIRHNTADEEGNPAGQGTQTDSRTAVNLPIRTEFHLTPPQAGEDSLEQAVGEQTLIVTVRIGGQAGQERELCRREFKVGASLVASAVPRKLEPAAEFVAACVIASLLSPDATQLRPQVQAMKNAFSPLHLSDDNASILEVLQGIERYDYYILNRRSNKETAQRALSTSLEHLGNAVQADSAGNPLARYILVHAATTALAKFRSNAAATNQWKQMLETYVDEAFLIPAFETNEAQWTHALALEALQRNTDAEVRWKRIQSSVAGGTTFRGIRNPEAKASSRLATLTRYKGKYGEAFKEHKRLAESNGGDAQLGLEIEAALDLLMLQREVTNLAKTASYTLALRNFVIQDLQVLTEIPLVIDNFVVPTVLIEPQDSKVGGADRRNHIVAELRKIESVLFERTITQLNHAREVAATYRTLQCQESEHLEQLPCRGVAKSETGTPRNQTITAEDLEQIERMELLIAVLQIEELCGRDSTGGLHAAMADPQMDKQLKTYLTRRDFGLEITGRLAKYDLWKLVPEDKVRRWPLGGWANDVAQVRAEDLQANPLPSTGNGDLNTPKDDPVHVLETTLQESVAAEEMTVKLIRVLLQYPRLWDAIDTHTAWIESDDSVKIRKKLQDIGSAWNNDGMPTIATGNDFDDIWVAVVGEPVNEMATAVDAAWRRHMDRQDKSETSRIPPTITHQLTTAHDDYTAWATTQHIVTKRDTMKILNDAASRAQKARTVLTNVTYERLLEMTFDFLSKSSSYVTDRPSEPRRPVDAEFYAAIRQCFFRITNRLRWGHPQLMTDLMNQQYPGKKSLITIIDEAFSSQLDLAQRSRLFSILPTAADADSVVKTLHKRGVHFSYWSAKHDKRLVIESGNDLWEALNETDQTINRFLRHVMDNEVHYQLAKSIDAIYDNANDIHDALRAWKEGNVLQQHEPIALNWFFQDHPPQSTFKTLSLTASYPSDSSFDLLQSKDFERYIAASLAYFSGDFPKARGYLNACDFATRNLSEVLLMGARCSVGRSDPWTALELLDRIQPRMKHRPAILLDATFYQTLADAHMLAAQQLDPQEDGSKIRNHYTRAVEAYAHAQKYDAVSREGVIQMKRRSIIANINLRNYRSAIELANTLGNSPSVTALKALAYWGARDKRQAIGLAQSRGVDLTQVIDKDDHPMKLGVHAEYLRRSLLQGLSVTVLSGR